MLNWNFRSAFNRRITAEKNKVEKSIVRPSNDSLLGMERLFNFFSAKTIPASHMYSV